MSDKGEIRRLKKENRKLKKKIYKLQSQMYPHGADKDDEKCFSAANYFSYLFAKLKQKKFFPTFQKYFKNSLWVTRIFRLGVLFYQYLQAGAFVLLYTAAFILVIPIILSISLLTLIVALVLRNKSTKFLFKELKNDVVFIIPKSKENFSKAVLHKICAEHKEKSVFLVSPFFLSKGGIGKGGKMYVCYRKECDNVYILRNYFFFYFRRRLKTEKTCAIEEIYLD